MTDTFSRNLIISVAAHAGLAAMFILRATFMPSQPIEIRRAIRVDVVGLPTKMPEDVKLPPPPTPTPAAPAAPTPPAPPKPEPVAKELPRKTEPVKIPAPTSKKDLAKSQKQALNQIKAMQALEKMKDEVGKEKPQPAAKAPVIAGNQVSPGNSLTGLEKIDYDRYFDELEGRVRSAWSIPQWLADAPLKAQVQILIDERGYVIKKIFRRSSGNDVFDAKVIEAIDASSPLPPPPQRLKGVLSTGGIILNFPE